MPLVINAFRGRHTHTRTHAHTHTHAYRCANQSNFKKPGVRGPQPACAWFKNNFQVKIILYMLKNMKIILPKKLLNEFF